jgi:hypothetical protein
LSRYTDFAYDLTRSGIGGPQGQADIIAGQVARQQQMPFGLSYIE